MRKLSDLGTDECLNVLCEITPYVSNIVSNRVILEEFISLAMLTPEEEKLIRTRAAGWSQTRQCHALNVSLATVTRMVRKLKSEYDSVRKYSKVLPENLDF